MNKQEKLEKLTSEYKDCEGLVDDLRDYISAYVPSPMREGDVLPTLEMLWKSITVMYYVSKESCERKKKERICQDKRNELYEFNESIFDDLANFGFSESRTMIPMAD